jgi:hypothetical protein
LKITNLNIIRVIPFCGKVDEWPIWSERFLAKSRRFDFKDLSLEKMSIPVADKDTDGGTESGKKKFMTVRLNEMTYTELILLIDVKISSGKVTLI